MRSPILFIRYCWKTSSEANKKCSKGRFSLFIDMLRFGFKYESTTIKYMSLRWYELNDEEKERLSKELIKCRDFTYYRYELRRFFSEYGSVKYENPKLWAKRKEAYTKMFNAGKNLSVRYGVAITTTHESMGNIKIGDNVNLSRDVDIDITGGLIIGNGTHISEGTRILTHGHNFFGKLSKFSIYDKKERAYLTPLSIEDNVVIGANCLIMPGVTSIGENSIVSAGSIVTKKIPANSLVAGNPAKVIGSIEGLRMYYYYPKKEHILPIES